jgi:hypothetical protein
LHANFHTLAIAIGAFGGVWNATRALGLGSFPSRAFAACLTFATIVIKHALIYASAYVDSFQRMMQSIRTSRG